jgi:hypothetical protein
MQIEKINIENKYDSKLINIIIELEKEENEIKKEYIDIEFKKDYFLSFETIKELSREEITNLVYGLMYFCSDKLLDDLLHKVAKEIREIYNDRKGVENYIVKKGLEDWGYVCKNSNLGESFFLKNTFRLYDSKEKVINWLRKNPIYSFDNILEKYIS